MAGECSEVLKPFWQTPAHRACLTLARVRRTLRTPLSLQNLLPLLFVALPVSGWPAVSALNIHDTGYEVDPLITNGSAYWLDNERLLFFGMRAGHGPRPDIRKLYIWDAKTNKTQFYAEALGVCVSDGFVSYRLRVDIKARIETVKEGTFGSEKEITRPLPPKGSLHSKLTCKSHLRIDLRPQPHRQHVVVVLKNGHGYLDLGPHIGAALDEGDAPIRNVILYRANAEAVRLPMTWEERFSQFGVTYSAYRKAYVLVPGAPRGAPVGILGPWPKNRPLKVYLLQAEGAIAEISIPYSPSEYLGDPKPVKPGWIYGGGDFYRSSGLYLFDGKGISKLDRGLVKETAVSADGCKAAVAIQTAHLRTATPTNLKVFDFCR